jgi:hypothetical protein
MVAALFAIAGLDAWRRQMVGKRRMELAEQVLAAVYQYRDAMKWIRSPGSFGGEGESRKAGDNETEEERREKNMRFITIERAQANIELLNEMTRLSYLARVYFGPQVSGAFQDLHLVLVKVRSAATMLIMTSTRGEKMVDIQNWESEVWDHSDKDKPDEVTKEIDDAVAIFESVCRQHVQVSPSPWFLRWLVKD